MSPVSSVYVESDEFERQPDTRRARSDENLDFLKDQERWRQLDQERQMVAYILVRLSSVVEQIG
jgi:hypothetical protein